MKKIRDITLLRFLEYFRLIVSSTSVTMTKDLQRTAYGKIGCSDPTQAFALSCSALSYIQYIPVVSASHFNSCLYIDMIGE